MRIALAVVLMTSAAFAAPKTYDLDYEVDPACPNLERFVGEIASRAEGAEFRRDGAQHHFSVRISPVAVVWDGSVVLDPSAAPRSVRGGTCEAVAEALALIIALELERAPETRSSRDAAPIAKPPKIQPRSIAAPSQTALRAAIGAGGIAVFGPAPQALWGPSVFGEIGARDDVTFRLYAAHISTGIESVEGGELRFELTSARLEGCVAPIATDGPFRATGCAAFEVGSLHAEGIASVGGLDKPQSISRWWLEPGLSLRFGWTLVEGLRLELGPSAGVPLTRRSFVFEGPRRVVQEPPLFVGRGGIWLVGELP